MPRWRGKLQGPPILLSVIGVVVGCIGGILLVPHGPLVPEELRWSGIAFAGGVVFGPIMAAARRPDSLLHPVTLLLVGIVFWLLLDLIQARYLPEVADMLSLRLAFFAIGLFGVGILLGSAVHPPQLPALMVNAARVSLNTRLLFRLGVLAFVLSFMRFAIPANFDLVAMYNALFVNRFSAPWSRGALGGWDAFLDHMSYFGYLLPSLAVLLYRSESKISWRAIVLASMAVVIGLLMAQGGGRRTIGALALSGGLVWVLTARSKGRALLLTGMLGLPPLMMYLQFILLTRSSGMGMANSIDAEDLFVNRFSVDDNINRLAQLIEMIPESFPHVGFDWVIWLLARPIPRVFWPGKPEGVGFDLAAVQGMSDVSLTFSVVGESYLAFGMVGCLVVGLMYGYISRWLTQLWDYREYPGAILMYSLGLLSLFVGLRSAVEFVLLSYGILAWILLAYFIPRPVRWRRV